jgi:hypothetical protein
MTLTTPFKNFFTWLGETVSRTFSWMVDAFEVALRNMLSKAVDWGGKLGEIFMETVKHRFAPDLQERLVNIFLRKGPAGEKMPPTPGMPAMDLWKGGDGLRKKADDLAAAAGGAAARLRDFINGLAKAGQKATLGDLTEIGQRLRGALVPALQGPLARALAGPGPLGLLLGAGAGGLAGLGARAAAGGVRGKKGPGEAEGTGEKVVSVGLEEFRAKAQEAVGSRQNTQQEQLNVAKDHKEEAKRHNTKLDEIKKKHEEQAKKQDELNKMFKAALDRGLGAFWWLR